MAKIIENEKGFKVIEISAKEMLQIGCFNMCDRCGEQHFGNGYYVAVLNCWLCPTCYMEWYEEATNHAEGNNNDAKVEEKNFALYKLLLGLKD